MVRDERGRPAPYRTGKTKRARKSSISSSRLRRCQHGQQSMRARLANCFRKIRYPGIGFARIIMDSSQDLKPLRDSVHSTLVTVTRSVNTLANEDLQFQRTVHPSVAARLDQNTDRLLELARGVLKSASKFTAQREPQLEDVDDVEIQWKGVLDVIDSLLEKSDTCLDEYTGLVKRKDAPTPESVRLLKYT